MLNSILTCFKITSLKFCIELIIKKENDIAVAFSELCCLQMQYSSQNAQITA